MGKAAGGRLRRVRRGLVGPASSAPASGSGRASHFSGVAEVRRFEMTARHHERMAELFREAGREQDAEAATRAAALCRESAARAGR